MSSGRCNNVGGGRTMVVSKEGRVVNGGGYVNHCERALDGKNEMVMATSEISVTASGDQQTMAAATSATNNNRVYLASCTELASLKELALSNLDLIDEFKTIVLQKDEKITQLSKKVEYLQQKLDETNQRLAEIVARDESLDVLPFTPVSSTCSSGMGDLGSAELQEQQEVKPKRRRNRQAASKQPNLGQIEPNLVKKQRTRSTRNKSGEFGKVYGKMRELTLITSDNEYYTCLGNYDPVKDDPAQENGSNNLEIPSWRVKTYSSWYSMEGTENMSDDVFENRHSRLELNERKRKRWDMQRIRELKRIEYLKEGRNRHNSQNSSENDKEELTTLLPSPANIRAIEITDNLPVSAFGCNLLIKKRPEFHKFFRSKWCQDRPESEKQEWIRELHSSGPNQFYDPVRVL